MTRAHLAAVASIGAVAIAAAGCGSSSKSSSGSSSSPASTPKPAAGTTLTAKKTSLGTILTADNGRTLYLFEKDTGPKSQCSGACASSWPPFTASSKPSVSGGAQSSDIKLVKRSDGKMQVTYKNHPLYFYTGDQSAGQMNGQGLKAFGAEWYVLSPSGSKVEKEKKSSGGSSSSSSGKGYGSGY